MPCGHPTGAHAAHYARLRPGEAVTACGGMRCAVPVGSRAFTSTQERKGEVQRSPAPVQAQSRVVHHIQRVRSLPTLSDRPCTNTSAVSPMCAPSWAASRSTLPWIITNTRETALILGRHRIGQPHRSRPGRVNAPPAPGASVPWKQCYFQQSRLKELRPLRTCFVLLGGLVWVQDRSSATCLNSDEVEVFTFVHRHIRLEDRECLADCLAVPDYDMAVFPHGEIGVAKELQGNQTPK